jgi:hypothetical protein
MAKMMDEIHGDLVVLGNSKDVFTLIEALEASDSRLKKEVSSSQDLSIRFRFKFQNPPNSSVKFPWKAQNSLNVFIDALIEQQDAQMTRINLHVKESPIIGGTSKDVVRYNLLRDMAFGAFVTIIEGHCKASQVSPADVAQIYDVSTLMAMTEASGSSDAVTMRLIEIAKHHEESGNQVEALLILAPLAAKYCMPAIDALTRISAEKGDMAGLQSWSAKKAEAMQIVSSGHGSAISGVSRSVLPQLAAMGLVATNMNLIGIKNEVNEMANEDSSSDSSDFGWDF